MTILVTGANGQLGNEMRIISKEKADKYIFTDVNQVEGFDTYPSVAKTGYIKLSAFYTMG